MRTITTLLSGAFFAFLILFGNSAQAQDLIITTEICGNTGGSAVRLTGPWWGWNPTGGPVAVDNGNGTYTFTLSPAPTADMEYLLVVDGVQENLISAMQNGGTCAPITDFATYANRQWLTTDPLSISNVYDQCDPCTAVQTDLVITTEVCGNTGGSEVRMTGPWWGWNPTGGPVAVDNGNGTYTFTLSPAPTADMEYLLVFDGVQENLVAEMQNGGSCAPITDFATYANRQWLTTDPMNIDNVYGQCGPCMVDMLDITIDVCGASPDSVGITGPEWGWNIANSPSGTDNGNGTWTVSIPEPTSDLEYKLWLNGAQEDLILDMADGGTCAPITDYATYANRQWLTTDTNAIDLVYDRCVACSYPDVSITVEVCDTVGVSEVRLVTEPMFDWNDGKIGTDNGDGTWTFVYAPIPADTLEYLISVDQVTEDLVQEMIDGGDCAPATDLSTYAHREWALNDPTTISITYDQCISCLTSSLEELQASIAVYPNPTNNVVSISGVPAGFEYHIFNAVGQEILNGSNMNDIDVSGLKEGVYFIELTGNDIKVNTSFVKQ